MEIPAPSPVGPIEVGRRRVGGDPQRVVKGRLVRGVARGVVPPVRPEGGVVGAPPSPAAPRGGGGRQPRQEEGEGSEQGQDRKRRARAEEVAAGGAPPPLFALGRHGPGFRRRRA